MTDTNIGGHDRAKFGMYRNTFNGTYERSCCRSGNPLLSGRRSEVKPQLLITGVGVEKVGTNQAISMKPVWQYELFSSIV